MAVGGATEVSSSQRSEVERDADQPTFPGSAQPFSSVSQSLDLTARCSVTVLDCCLLPLAAEHAGIA